jgi:hypothetical protein
MFYKPARPVVVRPSAKPSQVQKLDHLRHIISVKPPQCQVNISDPKPRQTTAGHQKFFAIVAPAMV